MENRGTIEDSPLRHIDNNSLLRYKRCVSCVDIPQMTHTDCLMSALTPFGRYSQISPDRFKMGEFQYLRLTLGLVCGIPTGVAGAGTVYFLADKTAGTALLILCLFVVPTLATLALCAENAWGRRKVIQLSIAECENSASPHTNAMIKVIKYASPSTLSSWEQNVENGNVVNKRDPAGFSFLELCTKEDEINRLIEAGADPFLRLNHHRESPIERAVSRDQLWRVRAYLRDPSDPTRFIRLERSKKMLLLKSVRTKQTLREVIRITRFPLKPRVRELYFLQDLAEDMNFPIALFPELIRLGANSGMLISYLKTLIRDESLYSSRSVLDPTYALRIQRYKEIDKLLQSPDSAGHPRRKSTRRRTGATS